MLLEISLRPFMSSRADIYGVQVLGRCGEGIKHEPVALTFKHWAYVKPVTSNACTDAAGCVTLGALPGIHRLILYIPSPSRAMIRASATWHSVHSGGLCLVLVWRGSARWRGTHAYPSCTAQL